MKRRWGGEIKGVILLEMKKTFFAKRGLWIYVLAALPVLLFVAYIVASSERQHLSSNVARQGGKALTYQDLQTVKPGMTTQEVIAMLGKPPITFHWTENRPSDDQQGSTDRVPHEDFHYSDSQHDRFV